MTTSTYIVGQGVSLWLDGTKVLSQPRDGCTTVNGIIKRRVKGEYLVVFDKGAKQVKVPASYLRPGPGLPPIPEDDPMRRYAVTGYRELRGPDGPMFNATITYDGKRLLEVTQEGHGGANLYYPAIRSMDTHGAVSEAEKDARLWCFHYGYEVTHEALDLWVEWYSLHRPNGETAADYMEDFKRIMEPLDRRGV